MMQKNCKKCNQTKPLDNYEFMKYRQTYRNVCRDCQRVLASINARKRREQNRLSKSQLLPITEQKCCCCYETKKIDLFNKDSGRKSGYDNTCRECRKKYKRKNKDKINEYNASKRTTKKPRHITTHEELKAKKREYAKKNYESLLKRWSEMDYSECKEIAVGCNTRKEYEKKSRDHYNGSRINGWLDEFFPLYRNKIARRIYAYVFPDNTVYVGLTGNHKLRHRDHMVVKSSSVRKHMDETGLNPELNYLTDYMEEERAAHQEINYIKKFKAKGYTILNRVKAGGLGGYYKKYSIDDAKLIAKRCKSRTELRRKNASLYVLLKSCGMIDEILPTNVKYISEKDKRPSGYWTHERCMEEASKYPTRKQLSKHNQYVYSIMKQNGWLDDVLPRIDMVWDHNLFLECF